MDQNNIKRTERQGIHSLGSFFSKHGWLFREQHSEDYGIDAQVEIVKDNSATGDLIAIQVKTGASYFSECIDSMYIFRSNNKHIKYWVEHCLPVIVVLYHPDEDILYWEHVSDTSIVSTGKGWKIRIPKNKQLTEESFDELCKLTQPPPYIQNLNRLRLDKFWIDLVAEEEFVYVEFEDFINKSLPRFAIKIGCDDRDDIEEETWPTVYGVGLSIQEVLNHMFPWAIFEVDENAKEYNYDNDYFTEPEVFSSQAHEGIEPIYEDSEIVKYRLFLRLNKIGVAFLLLDNFLEEEDNVQERVFTLF